MTDHSPKNGPIEKKVLVAGVTSAVVSLIMAVLIKQWPAITQYSTEVEVVIAGVVTGVATFVAAWLAKHTARNDAQTRKTGTSDPIPPTDIR